MAHFQYVFVRVELAALIPPRSSPSDYVDFEACHFFSVRARFRANVQRL